VADLFSTAALTPAPVPTPTPAVPPGTPTATGTAGAPSVAINAARQPRSEVPTVIVDNVHVTYRILGAAKRGTNTPTSAFRRVISGQKSPAVREIHAIRGVSFAAYRGEAVGLIGSNGSGKSTILRAIAGLLPVNQGSVYTVGQPSLLGANAALLNDLTGEQNVILGLLAMGISLEEARSRCQEIIDFSGINERGDFSSLPMETYSSGMAARLRFAIAAAKLHDVLLVDEALATGDARFRRRSEQRVRELLTGAGTVFLVSHALPTIVETCSRTIWLESGVIRMDGPTAEVIEAYEHYMSK
jgi:teichoic acid transport system ATP-binding protein